MTTRSASVDDTDLALIGLLKADGRASFTELAQQVGLSREAARQRLDRLESSETVRVVGVVSPAVMGFHTLAAVSTRVTGSAQEAARALAEHPRTIFVASTAGGSDLGAEVICRDDGELLDVLDSIRALPGIDEVRTSIYLDVAKYGDAEETAGGPARFHELAASTQPVGSQLDLDADDLKIIEILRQNGRAAYSEIAEKLSMPYPSARRKAVRLIESDHLAIKTVVNPLVAPEQVQASVAVRVSSDIYAAAERLRSIPEVNAIVMVSGAFDLLLEVTCANKRRLAALVGTRLREIPGIAPVQTNLYLKIHKLAYTWSGIDALGQHF